MILNKYLAGFISVVVVLLTAFQAAVQGGLTPTETWQLIGLGIATFASVFVPLLESGWAGALKVGAAVIGAGITALIPLLNGQWDASSVTIVVLALFNALATQLGVNARVDSARKVVAESNADPHTGPSDELVALQMVDPKAVAASQNIDKQRIA